MVERETQCDTSMNTPQGDSDESSIIEIRRRNNELLKTQQSGSAFVDSMPVIVLVLVAMGLSFYAGTFGPDWEGLLTSAFWRPVAIIFLCLISYLIGRFEVEHSVIQSIKYDLGMAVLAIALAVYLSL